MRGNLSIAAAVADEGGADGLGVLLPPVLRSARERFPDLGRVTLAVADEVVCADVVASFDACREAGFLDVGIAEAGR